MELRRDSGDREPGPLSAHPCERGAVEHDICMCAGFARFANMRFLVHSKFIERLRPCRRPSTLVLTSEHFHEDTHAQHLCNLEIGLIVVLAVAAKLSLGMKRFDVLSIRRSFCSARTAVLWRGDGYGVVHYN